jgi:hypothetical protein
MWPAATGFLTLLQPTGAKPRRSQLQHRLALAFLIEASRLEPKVKERRARGMMR